MYSIAIDVGGTFTDCLVLDGKGQLGQFKAPTTADDPSKGFLNCLEKAARSAAMDPREFIGAVDWIDAPCYDGTRMLAGNRIPGPAIIEEEATTVVIPDSFVCTVDASGSYLLTRR